MKKVICAIHQPNFFPWLGYFDKIRRADIFIFLDAVQYPRQGSRSWISRVQINIQGNPAWIGCSIERDKSIQLIKETKIVNQLEWQKKMLETLRHSYSKRKGYKQGLDLIEPLIRSEEKVLSEYNIAAIKGICVGLGIQCRFVRQSELKVEGAATDLLINLIKAVGGTSYLCGGGAGGYQEDQLFGLNSVELIYQNYKPEMYGDSKHFINGLSVIDYLMEVGLEL